jgi:hypothetical protein
MPSGAAGVISRADRETAVRVEPDGREVPQLTRIEADWSGHCRTMTCGYVLGWAYCLLMDHTRSYGGAPDSTRARNR